MTSADFHALAQTFGLTVEMRYGEFLVIGSLFKAIDFQYAAVEKGATFMGTWGMPQVPGAPTQSTRRFMLA